jgi:hypothetical protein
LRHPTMKKKLLIAYSGTESHVATTTEYLNSFRRFSKYEVRYLVVTHGADVSDVNFNDFDAVLHSYCARLIYPGYVSPSYIEALKSFRGMRLLAVQDEYNRTNALRQMISNLRFHAVLTCVPQDSLEFVYPKASFPETEFITVLTGYVPYRLPSRGAPEIPLAKRPIVVGYRGRDIGGLYGRLGFDKLEIGRRMRQICEERGIPHDIETAEDKRIYGEAWYQFLSRCRTTLGTESGSNIFDFDGNLERIYKEMNLTGGGIGYDEFRQYTDPLEDRIQMGQLSPRIFEAAITRTPMVLFRGKYSDAIAPGDHYIELKKDFSNIDSVLAQISDLDGLEKLADRAYDHLITSGNYDYRGFVQIVENAIDRTLDRINFQRNPSLTPATGERHLHELPTGNKEQPTVRPRDPMFTHYRSLLMQYQSLEREFANETARLNKEVDRLQREFANETARLSKEIDRLNKEIYELTHFRSFLRRVAKAGARRLIPRY